MVLQNFTDLVALDQAFDNHTSLTPAPDADYPGSLVVTLQSSGTFDPWWLETATTDYLIRLDYRINEGYARVVRRTDPPAPGPDGIHIFLMNFASHFSDFSTKGFFDWLAPGNQPREGWPPWRDRFMNVMEQAVESGAILVCVSENLSGALWTGLQRTQEADHLVRTDTGLHTALGITGNDLGKSFVWGGSWGAQISGEFALLQGGVYDGAGSSFGADIGYHSFVGDWGILKGHMQAATGGDLFPEFRIHSNQRLALWNLTVDLLGIREGNGKDGMKEWDVGAFSQLYRPQDIGIRIDGLFGAEDNVLNWHWQSVLKDPGSPRHAPDYHLQIIQNQAHETESFVKDGVNEYYLWDGTEWDALKAGTRAAANPPLVPAEDPPSHGAYPDPYSHTLRHPGCSAMPLNDVLPDTFDLNPEAPGVDTMGQGVMIGRFDSMAVDDLDNDGKDEIFFGNLDGYFHVLQIDPSRYPGDPTRLTDEYKSPRLGWGLWALDFKSQSKVWVADSQGEIHRFRAVGTDAYTKQAFASVGEEGMVPFLYSGNFHDGRAGKEILVANRFLDWQLFDRSGGPLGNEKLWRGIQAFGPGQGAVVGDIPGLAQNDVDELLLPGLDGHVWYIQYNTSADRLIIKEAIGFTNRALYRLVPVDADGNDEPEYLLLFGRNDTEETPDRVMLYDFATATVSHDIGGAVEFSGISSGDLDSDVGQHVDGVAFAWIQPPSGPAPWTFVIGAGGKIEKFTLNPGGGPSALSTAGSRAVPPGQDPDADAKAPAGGITALAYTIPPGSSTGTVIAATGNGRIWFLDDDLDYLRTSGEEGVPVVGQESHVAWYSNRSFGHATAWDGHQDDPQYPDRLSLYVAELQHPAKKDEHGKNLYRIAELQVDDTSATLIPFVDTARHRGNKVLTRFLRYEDLDPAIPGKEAYTLADAGAIHVEASGTIRQFCNRSVDPEHTLHLKALGGYIFEAVNPEGPLPDYEIVRGFNIPRSQAQEMGYFDNQNDDDWYYPQVGDDRLGAVAGKSPQIATPYQSVGQLYQGTSMTIASIQDPGSGNPVPHIVTGTTGGYVYAVAVPDGPEGAQPLLTSLSYASDDLGWYVIGMDAGDLDTELPQGDDDDEIVVGMWVDTGNFDDWVADDKKKNRARLLILDPLDTGSEPRGFSVTELDGDDLSGQGCGISTGAFGVKIDDVNADGSPEIWCGDATGHIYLFRRSPSTGQWETFYRSGDEAVYPGAFNHFYPVKDSDTGKTIRLVVVSPGYVMGFEVDPTVLD